MTRQFSKVSPSVWGSRRFSELESDAAKILYMYFLTNEHMTSAGAYRIKEGYALADLAWPAEKYREGLTTLQSVELIAYDAPHETVYVLRWFKHNPPMNEKHAQGCRRMLLELDSQLIAEMAMTDFEEADARRMMSATTQPSVSPTLRHKLSAQSNGRSF